MPHMTIPSFNQKLIKNKKNLAFKTTYGNENQSGKKLEII